MTSSSVIQVRDLHMQFRGCDALRGLNLDVESGTLIFRARWAKTALAKTTLIKHPDRVLESHSPGTVSVLGLDPTRDAVEIRSTRLGYVADAPNMPDWMKPSMSLGWFTAGFYPDGYLETGIVSWYREIRTACGSQAESAQQRSAGQSRPELGPCTRSASIDSRRANFEDLSPLVRREFLESMVDRAATGRTVLLSSHQINEVERVADRVAIVHQGRCAF